jgi:hypothetical protein
VELYRIHSPRQFRFLKIRFSSSVELNQQEVFTSTAISIPWRACIELRPKKLQPISRIDHMGPAAPLFLAPANVGNESLTSIADSTLTPAPEEKEKGSASTDFLDVLNKAFAPCCLGGASSTTHITEEGHLMGLTENLSATYLSSGNACLDFFFQVSFQTVYSTFQGTFFIFEV